MRIMHVGSWSKVSIVSRRLASFLVAPAIAALLWGCQQSAPTVTDTGGAMARINTGDATSLARASQSRASGLLPRPSGLDSVEAVYALDVSGASVSVQPLQIDYRAPSETGPRPLSERSARLDASEQARLQELMAQAFAERFLAPRGSKLALDPGKADYRLQLRLENFALAGPLQPPTAQRRIFADQSAYGVLVGTLYDRDGNLVMRFRDRREIGERGGNIGPGSLHIFSGATFWSDMRMDMRRAFSTLDRSLR